MIDVILDEVRQVRESLAEEHNCDLHKLLEYLRRKQYHADQRSASVEPTPAISTQPELPVGEVARIIAD